MRKNKQVIKIIAIMAILFGVSMPMNIINASEWTDYLDEKSAEVLASFSWSSAISDSSKIWDGSVDVVTNEDNEGYFHVKTPQQFRWALENDKNVRLDNDLDLGGRNGIVWTKLANAITAKIDGNGYTLYNLNALENSMLEAGSNFEMFDINFESARIEGGGKTGIITPTVHGYRIHNVSVNNSLTIGDGDYIAILVSGIQAANESSEISNVFIKNSNVIAKSGRHHSLIAGGFDMTQVSYSATVDCTLISYGSHSGGFIGCSDQASTVENCFSNSTVYGYKETSAFAGLAGYRAGTEFKNCYVAGKVEGNSNISGFAFTLGSAENCYSTAMVGILNGGLNIAGMNYSSANAQFAKAKYKDIYVAGEVGDLTTPINKQDQVSAITVQTPLESENCYYDKQTTGMREDGEEKATGIYGVLTKDKHSAGTLYSGLTSAPGANGFKGFTDNSQWVFEEGVYPQLAVFANADENIWKENTDAVKAYSKASVQTIYLENYEKDYNENELPLTTYDTIRDITAKFSMSDGNWKSGYNTDGTFSEKLTVVNGKTYKILNLETINEKQWVTDFAPGVDWMQVRTTVNGEEGSRILRLCPTINLDPGIGQTVIVGNSYDHRLNASLAYTNAVSLANNLFLFEGSYNNATGNSNILNVSKMSEVDRLMGKTGNKMHVLVYNFATGDISQNASFTINELNDKLQNDVEVSTPHPLDEMYTGKEVFDKKENGFHLLEYVWELPDGRYVRNGKMITVKDVPFDIKANIVNDITQEPTGINLNDSMVKLGIAVGNNKTLSSNRVSQSSLEVNYGNAVTISWESPTDGQGNPINSLVDASLKSGTNYTEWRMGKYNKELNQFEITMYDYSIVKNTKDGSYNVVGHEINRVYPVVKTGDTYSVTFDFDSTLYKDVEDNIQLDLKFDNMASYTVKYDTNGGNSINDKIGVKFYDDNLLAQPPIKDGNTFLGWKFNDSFVSSNTKYNDLVFDDDTVMNITLQAQWQANNYSVKYDTGFEDIVINEKKGVLWNDNNLLPEQPRKDGYAFIGWQINDKLVSQNDTYGSLTTNQTPESFVTLKAKWLPLKDYSVIYNTNGGFLPYGIESVITGMKYEDVVVTPLPTRVGYTFKGWEYKGIKIKDNATYKAVVGDAKIKQIELVAQWEVNTYKVDFKYSSKNNPEGVLEPSGVTKNYGEIIDEPKMKIPNKWKFDGWYTNKECNDKYDFKTKIVTNMTLYGKWSYEDSTKPNIPINPVKPTLPPMEDEGIKSPNTNPKYKETIVIITKNIPLSKAKKEISNSMLKNYITIEKTDYRVVAYDVKAKVGSYSVEIRLNNGEQFSVVLQVFDDTKSKGELCLINSECCIHWIMMLLLIIFSGYSLLSINNDRNKKKQLRKELEELRKNEA